MNNVSLTNEEMVVNALLKTPEMKKHVTDEELAEYDGPDDLLFFSKNPYIKALSILIKGTTVNKDDKLIYNELITTLKSLED